MILSFVSKSFHLPAIQAEALKQFQVASCTVETDGYDLCQDDELHHSPDGFRTLMEVAWMHVLGHLLVDDDFLLNSSGSQDPLKC